ncbi:STAS domain-containing protein [Angelakisella massiliensis]|uniref:STAS domain-containing protein n=1 Tax=Angelakisella massiliensis TaxID=1871018 RepID=UPI0008F96327|nr:anti-sigma factor antagonist [Angelakisella massiliensis]
MAVKITVEEEQMTARLAGEIDHHAAQQLREEIDSRAQQCRPQRLVLDFARVEFMDSSGIGLVLGRYRLMEELGGQLIVTGLPRHLRKVMRVAGIESLPIQLRGGEDE